VLEKERAPLVHVACGRARLEDGRVDVVANRQPMPARVDVVGRRGPRGPELSLEADVPLVRVPLLHVERERQPVRELRERHVRVADDRERIAAGDAGIWIIEQWTADDDGAAKRRRGCKAEEHPQVWQVVEPPPRRTYGHLAIAVYIPRGRQARRDLGEIPAAGGLTRV